MDNISLISGLAKELKCDVRQNEPMSKHTTFKIGGNAALYIKVDTLDKLRKIVSKCKAFDVNYLVIGNGSNLLVGDEGIDSVIIRLDGDFRNIAIVDETTVYCGAGVTLANLCKFALNNGLSGLEFAWGIPGTVGGAVFMNAGAYGGEMKDVVCSVSHITESGEIGRTDSKNLNFGYRTSVYRENNCIITGITVKLKNANQTDIREKMDDYLQRRTSKQPLEYPSAGSVFKRPEGNFAGALIEQCGLKGRCVGNAQVSEKHAGFIINRGNATANDVKNLIKEVQNRVKSETGYDLECEIIML